MKCIGVVWRCVGHKPIFLPGVQPRSVDTVENSYTAKARSDLVDKFPRPNRSSWFIVGVAVNRKHKFVLIWPRIVAEDNPKCEVCHEAARAWRHRGGIDRPVIAEARVD